MDAQRFRQLSARQRALVSLAVLLDGREAAVFLENDALSGESLKRAALDVASFEVELRMSYLGTVLRAALREMK